MIVEAIYNAAGELIRFWEYPFMRLSGKGEVVYMEGKRYVIVSSTLCDRLVVTEVREVAK